jgi:hypothetical protein
MYVGAFDAGCGSVFAFWFGSKPASGVCAPLADPPGQAGCRAVPESWVQKQRILRCLQHVATTKYH